MKEQIYIPEEFLRKAGVDRKQLAEWERLKLFRPAGHTGDKKPFYSEKNVAEVQYLQKLLELGYEKEEIEKIIRKVGFPQSPEGRGRKKSGKYLTIGNLAEKVGVSARTLKHWEDKGIIEPDMRSEGGFRLYSEAYVHLCHLIQDLQLFGYSLEEIKTVSGYFRDFMAIQNHPADFSRKTASQKLDAMTHEIDVLFGKMQQLKAGIQRWEDLLKKYRKEVVGLKEKNEKRNPPPKG